MRNYSFLFCMALIIVLFSNCKKDEEDYYYSLGTLSKTEDSIIVLTDDDKRLLVNNPSSVSELDSNDRAIFYYTFFNTTSPTGIDKVIDVNYYEQVLFKKIINLTLANSDSIGHDPVLIKNMWIAKNYLNINFDVYGTGNIRHWINLTKSPGVVPTDTVKLEFRHNLKGDSPVNLYSGLVSFDLSPVKNNLTDKVVLQITAKDAENQEIKEFITYNF